MFVAARVMVFAAVELFENPGIFTEARADFDLRRGTNF
tara:strand:+ start:2242 stop:2355 length:114 start_codon:yes stop_codon:yes gene_type:complete